MDELELLKRFRPDVRLDDSVRSRMAYRIGGRRMAAGTNAKSDFEVAEASLLTGHTLPRISSRVLVPTLAALLGVGALIVVVGPRVGPRTNVASRGGEAVTTTTGAVDQELPPDSIPPEKQPYVDAERAAEAAGKADPAPKDPASVGTPTPEKWPAGIFADETLSPFGPQYRAENRWQEDRGANHVQLWAGALTDDPTQGVAWLLKTPLDPTASSSGKVFYTGKGGGPAKVVGATGDFIQLQTAQGVAYEFDVTKEALVRK